ncbi:unnamed protein product [Vitrella brassicaformis CCMP3155]|uniref:Uncharacterized protein n=1 Tax=Vitrella brassicaformis (strain CCMP3155) TaxID=1169540 RepID=A0A0G4GAF6_VITBC|nr:unnamed protein product [Vitrella brassicaformis CCMP3155]|eukprot:CEM25941.1 unnamed protein product [Vitrella brassicaformis CCMP3155]
MQRETKSTTWSRPSRGHIEIRLILKPGSGKPRKSDSVAKVFGRCGRDDRDPIRWQKTTRKRSLEDDDDRAPLPVSKLVVGEVDLAETAVPTPEEGVNCCLHLICVGCVSPSRAS